MVRWGERNQARSSTRLDSRHLTAFKNGKCPGREKFWVLVGREGKRKLNGKKQRVIDGCDHC